MRLFIIRHADPDYPNNTITPQGHLEAKALADWLGGQGLDFIYTSPLGRAIHTAQYTSERLGLEPGVEPWTAELGDCGVTIEPWGRMVVWNCPGEIIRGEASPPAREDWHQREIFADPLFRERFDHIQRESDAFIARHGYERMNGRYRIARPNRDRIAVFCHGGFALWWLAHLLEMPLPLMWSGFFLTPSSVTTILFEERSARWAVPRCVGLGDVTHLHLAGLPVTPRGIPANCE